jgi:dTDP-4-dehydrorhamnose reductase
MLLARADNLGAANRFPDKCDADPEGARALNVEATRALALATSSRKILLIYISTDYLFSGVPGEAPYESDAPTNPPNIYGQTKLDGEKVTLEHTKEANLGVVLRVPVLYGNASDPSESAINILSTKVWDAQKKDSKIEMDDWAKRYPTNTEDVARVCKDIAVRYTEVPGPERKNLPRILQFSSEDCYTKYEICQVMAEILGLPIDNIKAMKEGNKPGAGIQRPYDTHLSTKWLKDLGISVWTQDFVAWWYVPPP